MLGYIENAAFAASESGAEGIHHMPLKFDMPMDEWRTINRADLVFDDVTHIDQSYEVRAFFNNKNATSKTARTAANGYAGRFVIFGHGNCFGAAGHCDPVSAVNRSRMLSSAPQLEHPAAPQQRILTVTKALERVLKRFKNGLHTVTLVTTLKAPRRKDRKPISGLFKCSRVSLQLYR